MRIGYLGPKGTFSEEAAQRYAANASEAVQGTIYPSILDVLQAVAEGEIERGVVPIENSIEGSVNMTLDGLVQDTGLFVEAELVLPIEQTLLVRNEKVTLQDIREIWSHPQALAQCRSFIRSLGVPVKAWDSTAAAAAEIASTGRRDVAAIGTKWAAQVFDLHVLQANLQDNSANHTRFVVVRNGEVQNPEADKTMLHIVMDEDRAGALVHVLNLFAAVSLNLSRIESRPTRKKLGTYQFFLDVEAGAVSESLQNVLAMIELLGHQVRILGSYRQTRR